MQDIYEGRYKAADTEGPWAADIKRLLSDPSLKITIDFNADAGCEQYSVVVIESSDAENDKGFWLASFPDEQGARGYISEYGLSARFDGKCTDIRDREIRQHGKHFSLNYDERFDILSVGIKQDRTNSAGAEEYDGLVVMRDRATREATGLVLYDFKKKLNGQNLPSFPSDIEISIENDVLPYINF
jgi:hypothetical protein